MFESRHRQSLVSPSKHVTLRRGLQKQRVRVLFGSERRAVLNNTINCRGRDVSFRYFSTTHTTQTSMEIRRDFPETLPRLAPAKNTDANRLKRARVSRGRL